MAPLQKKAKIQIPYHLVSSKILAHLSPRSKAMYRSLNSFFDEELKEDPALVAEYATRRRIRRLTAPRIAYYMGPAETVADAIRRLEGTAELRDFLQYVNKYISGAGGRQNNAYLGWTIKDIESMVN